MREILIISILVFIFSCRKEVEPIRNTDPELQISFLAEIDGCKIYRFKDGEFVYFVKCENSTYTTSNHVRCYGKSCSTIKKQSITYMGDAQ